MVQLKPYTVQVDHREATGSVTALLMQSSDFHVTVTHLKLGDYLVDGRFLFERKTMLDLAMSIIDGRLFEQALRLASTSLRPAIILEGAYQEPAESAMRWESILGALVTVTIFFGIPLLVTRTPDETARAMLYAARQANAVATGAVPRHGYRPRGRRARQIFILQGLPGIGPELARRLLARFGSVEAVMNSSTEDLQSVTGIGSGTAENIRWAVEEPFYEYSVAAARRV